MSDGVAETAGTGEASPLDLAGVAEARGETVDVGPGTAACDPPGEPTVLAPDGETPGRSKIALASATTMTTAAATGPIVDPKLGLDGLLNQDGSI